MIPDGTTLPVFIATLKSECEATPDIKQRLVQNPVKELYNRGLTVDEMIQFYDFNGLRSIIGQDNISSIIGQDNISSTTERNNPAIIGQQC